MYVGTYMLQGTCGGQRKTVEFILSCHFYLSPRAWTQVTETVQQVSLPAEPPWWFYLGPRAWTQVAETVQQVSFSAEPPWWPLALNSWSSCLCLVSITNMWYHTKWILLVLQTLSFIYLWSWINNTQMSCLHWRRVIVCPSSDFKSTKAAEFSHRATKPSSLFWCFTYSSYSNHDPPLHPRSLTENNLLQLCWVMAH